MIRTGKYYYGEFTMHIEIHLKMTELILSTHSKLIAPQFRLHSHFQSPWMKEVSFSVFSNIPHLNLGTHCFIVSFSYVHVLSLQTNQSLLWFSFELLIGHLAYSKFINDQPVWVSYRWFVVSVYSSQTLQKHWLLVQRHHVVTETAKPVSESMMLNPDIPVKCNS